MKLPFGSSSFCLAVGLILWASPKLLAQDPAAETLQQRVALPSEAAPPTAPETAGNKDLGEISPVQTFPKPAMFTVATVQQVFYTDNVFYTDANRVGSTAYLGSYTASFVPYSLRDWTPRISLQYNMARYDRAAAGDFDNENLALSSQYVFSEDRAWSWTTTVDLSRFTAPHLNGTEFYKEIVYDNQITYVKQLLKDDPLFFVGAYDLAYHQANPAIYDRLDNTLSFSVAYYPIPELSIGPFVRPGARTYVTDGTVALSTPVTQHDRNDFNLSEGLDVTWRPCEYVSLSADVVHTDDYSSSAGLSYYDTIPGFDVTGTISF
jgi:hypothetical protein